MCVCMIWLFAVVVVRFRYECGVALTSPRLCWSERRDECTTPWMIYDGSRPFIRGLLTDSDKGYVYIYIFRELARFFGRLFHCATRWVFVASRSLGKCVVEDSSTYPWLSHERPARTRVFCVLGHRKHRVTYTALHFTRARAQSLGHSRLKRCHITRGVSTCCTWGSGSWGGLLMLCCGVSCSERVRRSCAVRSRLPTVNHGCRQG